MLDCDRELPLGAELQYRCQNRFRNFNGIFQGGQMKCGSQGGWIKFQEFQEFQCLPGNLHYCGLFWLYC